MTRPLGVSTVLALALALPLGLLAGCGDDGGADGGADGGGNGGGADRSASTSEEGDPETETFARGADVADFCAAMTEIDSAIDEANQGSDEEWQRIVASFDALEEVGVPDDLPASGIAEITEVELLVRQSDSVAAFSDAAEDYQPESRTIDDYLEDNCSP